MGQCSSRYMEALHIREAQYLQHGVFSFLAMVYSMLCVPGQESWLVGSMMGQEEAEPSSEVASARLSVRHAR